MVAFWITFGLIMGLIVLPLVLQLIAVPPIIFKVILARTRPEKWARNQPSDLKDEDMVMMWGKAIQWRESYKNNMSPLEVKTSDGLKLVGEYYDFGSDKTVIIAPGRPETLVYSAYYAESYRLAGVNVCLFDQRAHGDSEGYWHGCGYQEKEDIIAFAKLLNEKYGQKIILHGICIGASSCSFALTDEKTPPYMIGYVSDGAFIHMYECLWIRIHRNSKLYPWPAIAYFRYKIKKLYGVDIKKVGPITRFPKIKVPTLMMASKEDIFSLPEKTALLHKSLNCPKTMVWWEKGRHSHLRSLDENLYNKSIADFVKTL